MSSDFRELFRPVTRRYRSSDESDIDKVMETLEESFFEAKILSPGDVSVYFYKDFLFDSKTIDHFRGFRIPLAYHFSNFGIIATVHCGVTLRSHRPGVTYMADCMCNITRHKVIKCRNYHLNFTTPAESMRAVFENSRELEFT